MSRFSYKNQDHIFKVRENFRRMAEAIVVEPDSLVFAMQTHTTNVRKVTTKDRGKGIVYPPEYQDVIAAIGPSICQDCYEVSEDVINKFKGVFDKKHWKDLFYQKEKKIPAGFVEGE